MPSVIITEKDNGSNVVGSVDGIAELHLEENPTTGFLWTFEEMSPGLVIVHDEFHMAGTPLVPGAGGVHEWRLRVTEPGDHTLRLRLGQAWEEESAANRRFTVAIVAD